MVYESFPVVAEIVAEIVAGMGKLVRIPGMRIGQPGHAFRICISGGLLSVVGLVPNSVPFATNVMEGCPRDFWQTKASLVPALVRSISDTYTHIVGTITV
jgi:hypothetical protein